MAEKIKKLYNGSWGEAIRYIIIGGCTTLISVCLFAIYTKAFFINVTVSNVISIIVAVIFAYIANKLFVFRSYTKTARALITEAAKFFGGRVATMILEVFGVFLLVNIIGQDAVVGKIETQVLVLVGNYMISKFLVFRKPPKK